ncbi:MAG: 4-(cytidine 5'-diphospho)-2-C-methyl-D-erythritol kinase [Candidatus Limivicinus sp.]|nr:4-(cytidine 5'-diphospho)-2-C-methyl-D-erythritol kinase [Candidatus Limivicinus sp.]
MKTVHEKAYAKLNISLDVGKRREDGFHEMTMVMQSISLADAVTVTLNDTGRVRARTSLPFIPGDERNLAVKAALCYLEAIGRQGQGAWIEIQKAVPVGAGMGGGSSDAAAVLRAMNALFDHALSTPELEKLSCAVGSDVAFCVAGGTALATGRGEKLEALPPLPDCAFVVCKPEFSISTPELFRKLDQMPLRRHPDTAGLTAAIREGQLGQVCRRMYNVFEDVDDRRMRTVADIKSRLLDAGALGAVMTGTGSAVFGVFAPGQAMESVCSSLRREYGFCESAVCVGRLEE